VEALLARANVLGYECKLVITGQDPIPIEIAVGGITISRHDLKLSMRRQMKFSWHRERKYVGVIADDTDIYVMFLCHYYNQSLNCPMTMIPTHSERTVNDIKCTALKLGIYAMNCCKLMW